MPAPGSGMANPKKHLSYVPPSLEAGYDGVHDKVSGVHHTLIKTTLAAELATDKGVWKRPVLRLFYTAADWSDGAKGMVGGDYYAGKTSGDNIGIQLEYWW